MVELAVNRFECDPEGKLIEFSFGKWNPNGKLTMVKAYTKDTKSIGDGTAILETATVDAGMMSRSSMTKLILPCYAGHLENGKMSKSDPGNRSAI